MKTAALSLPWHANGLRYCAGPDGERICTGAAMGRRNAVPPDVSTVRKLHLRRVPLSDGGCYDKGGAYWGQGAPLWCAFGESDTEQAVIYFRAATRDAAKITARQTFPNAKFYR